jgi:putative thioredoxin
MEFSMQANLTPQNGQTPANDLIKDSDTANFAKDVMEASQTVPVLVDFWAPWCGPCKQLGPMIEKAVTEAGGKVKLVKIDIDQNQGIAGQLGIQSIPAVIAFVGGQPIDGFMGAVPESEIKAFIEKITSQAPKNPNDPAAQIEAALEQAQTALDTEDFGTASQIYAQILQFDPQNDASMIGIATIHHKMGNDETARDTMAKVSEEGQESPAYKSLDAALKLGEEASDLGGSAKLEAELENDPENHQLRYDLALAFNAEGEKLKAAEQLLHIMKADREWNEDGARVKLLELFDAWGPADPATAKARRMLSGLLFS